LNLRRVGFGSGSIHEKHFFLLQNLVGVNLNLHSMMVLQAEQGTKLKYGDLIASPICHPQNLLMISIKIESGIESADDLFVLVILEAHHLSHLQLRLK
jgi:hypothetical protein